MSTSTIVMPDFMSGIHDLRIALISKSWMPATSAGMTALRFNVIPSKPKALYLFVLSNFFWINRLPLNPKMLYGVTTLPTRGRDVAIS